MGARQFCRVDGVSVQSAAIALHSAPGARRLEIGGALVTAALASKIQMAGIYAIQAMESAEGAVDAPAGTEAETVVHRLAAQNVRSFREHHSRLAAGCHFGSSLIQNGSQLIFARPPTLIGLGLLELSSPLRGCACFATNFEARE